MDEMLQVGIITASHGLKGEVKVFPTTDDVKRFKKLKEVILNFENKDLKLEVEGVKFFKNQVILKFKGLDNIDDIMKFKSSPIYVTRDNAIKCDKDEYFIADLIDMNVFDEDEKLIGKIVDVIQTGANDVYVVSDSNKKEILIPAIRECILMVDVIDKRMVVHLMDGLI